MRTLAMALAAVALSWAHVAGAEEAQQGSKMQTGAQQTREEAQEQGATAEPKMNEMMKSEHPRAGEAKGWQFEGKQNFDVKGKISKVSGDSITLSREDLPAATLKVSKDTKIELDGSKASIGQLQQGQDVRASFNLEGEKPLAVEIKAEKATK